MNLGALHMWCFWHMPLTKYCLKDSDDVWATPHLVCIQSVFYLSACVWGVIGAGGRGMMTAFVSQLLQHVLGLINMVVKDLWYEEFMGSLSVKKTSRVNSLLFRNGVKQCRAGVPPKNWQTVYVENFGCYSTIIEVSSLPHRSRCVNVSSDGNI